MKTYQLNKNQSSFGGKIVYAAIIGIGLSILSNTNLIKEKNFEENNQKFVGTSHIHQENSSVHSVTDVSTSYSSYNSITLKSQHATIEKNTKIKDDIKNEMLSAVERIKSLKEGWDGNDAEQASEAAVSDAITFIEHFPLSVIHKPVITLAADGEINFFWKLENFSLDLGLYGDGHYSYYGITNDKKEFFGDEKNIVSFNTETAILELLS